MLEQLINHSSRPDFPLVGGKVPLDLHKIAHMPGGQATVETLTTKLRLDVSVSPRNVKILPERPPEEEFFNPKIFIQAYVNGSNEIGLAVYTKRTSGSYFDKDFRAEPLTRTSVEYLLAKNQGISAILSEYVPGSDTYAMYMFFKDQYLAEGIGEKEARKLAIGEVWTYTHIASQVGFTQIEEVREECDDRGRLHVYGKFTKKARRN